MVNLK